MEQFTINDNVLRRYNDNTWVEYLKIPKGITTIRYGAFTDCRNIANVILPEGLEIIDSRAFEDCSNLKSIVIPEGVDRIGFMAFKNCVKLDEINLPNSLKIIGYDAFDGCQKLKRIYIPDAVNLINTGVFKNCTSLESISIPYGITIADSAFDNCCSLNKVNIRKGNKSFGFYLLNKDMLENTKGGHAFTKDDLIRFKKEIDQKLSSETKDVQPQKMPSNQAEKNVNALDKKELMEITARLDAVEKKYEALMEKYKLLCRIVSMNRTEEFTSFYELTEAERKKIAESQSLLNELL